ncbi:ABC transporter substrate-binding protein [Streptomyces collinus]|uniref:ABC transporter substrate-binding protein n=1 Tax=Streptomyces collinus TaxID=42684 RepID=UPI00367E74AC
MNSVRAAVTLLAALTLTTACGLPDKVMTPSSVDSQTIKIGAVSSLSGPATFPDSTSAAQAVFDQINDSGGIGGRKIDYIVVDDKGDPAATAQAARSLVTQKHVVALAGSASLLDCAINAHFYAKAGVSAIQGVGVDPTCFESSAISPVNVGPYLSTAENLYYASEVLKLSRICLFIGIYGNTDEAYKKAVESWSDLTGKKPLMEDRTIKAESDPTPFVLRAKKERCQAALYNGTEPSVIAMMKSAKQQNATDIKWIMTSAAYTEALAKALGKNGEGLYTNAEFEPFTRTDSPLLSDWRKLLIGKNVPLSSFSEGGYLAAKHIVEVLKSLDGPITRRSVTEALKSLQPIESEMTGTAYEFGDATEHHSNTAGKIVQLRNGGWHVVSKDWIRYPGKID